MRKRFAFLLLRGLIMVVTIQFFYCSWLNSTTRNIDKTLNNLLLIVYDKNLKNVDSHWYKLVSATLQLKQMSVFICISLNDYVIDFKDEKKCVLLQIN